MDTNDLKRRLGKIKISEPFFWDLKSMGVLLRNCIVLDVDHWDYNLQRVYIIAHPEFDHLEMGEAIPEYVATLGRHENGDIEIGKWEKVS